jgi:CRISPR system Cascade subunit CasC
LKFIQIHSLTSYPAALLNRDDAGLAKRIPFGGAVRTRISSQCLKRHWRRADTSEALKNCDDGQLSVRSRLSFERFVYQRLVDDGIDAAIAHGVTDAMMSLVLTGKIEKKGKASTELRSEQVTVIGRRELDFLHTQASEICSNLRDATGIAAAVDKHFDHERKENIQALVLGSGIDAAMFGRFITGDVLARVDAAVHVAHAFTVHAEESESDYFSAVDDLQQEEGTPGAGHINTAELTSGLFYGYVVVHVPGLATNLGQDRRLAAEVTRRLVHLIATVSPGAKLGSTAPHSFAHLVLAEATDTQPRTLGNAFLTPVRLNPDLLANAYDALAAHLAELDRCYGRTARKAIALSPGDRLLPVLTADERAGSLADLGTWTAAQIEAGQ